MPSKLLLGVRNAADYSTLTATPAPQLTLPVSNLQLAARGRVWRSTSTAAQTIKGTWGGQAWFINYVMLSRHNLTAAATWRVQLFPNADWTGTPVDSGTVAAYNAATLGSLSWGKDPLGSGVFDGFLGQLYSLWFPTRTSVLSYQIDITDAANSDKFMQASRLHMGDALEAIYSGKTADLVWQDATQQNRSLGGTLRSDGGAVWRELDLPMQIDASQRDTFMDMTRYAGKKRDIFVSVFPAQNNQLERDHTMLAKFVDPPKVHAEPGALYSIATARLAEA